MITTEYNMQIEVENLILLGAVQNYYLFGLCHEISQYGIMQFEWRCLNTIAFMHLEGIRFTTDLSVLQFEFHNYGTMDASLRDKMISDANAEYEAKYDL